MYPFCFCPPTAGPQAKALSYKEIFTLNRAPNSIIVFISFRFSPRCSLLVTRSYSCLTRPSVKFEEYISFFVCPFVFPLPSDGSKLQGGVHIETSIKFYFCIYFVLFFPSVQTHSHNEILTLISASSLIIVYILLLIPPPHSPPPPHVSLVQILSYKEIFTL